MLALLATLLLAGAIFVWKAQESAAHNATAAPAGTAGATPSLALAASGAASNAASRTAEQTKHDQLQALKEQLVAAQQRLSSYQAATRYPPESRPISEHGDQIKPFNPIVDVQPLRNAQGDAIPGRHLLTHQDRVYVSGQESALFTVQMQDDQGHAAPLRVMRATTHEVQDATHTQTVSQMAVQFEDRGANGDALAGDGIYSARLQPAAQGFANTQGTIRVDLDLQSNTGGSAHAFFDIIYTPTVPATWSGAISESVDGGSLTFHLGADVREAGRYVINARVYDASGKPFALLEFNDELPTGHAEVPLTLFGKLIRDAKPVFPLTLRDLQGFVLYENRFPDRAMMPRRPQAIYTSGVYPPAGFSDAEWSSPDRQRHLDEYTRDVTQLQQTLRPLQP
ncbi:MAG: hypothetical protein KGL90_05480 [Burkholderiales bacterium]|nr:hypothetical protein [Burkholderiales bacterium]